MVGERGGREGTVLLRNEVPRENNDKVLGAGGSALWTDELEFSTAWLWRSSTLLVWWAFGRPWPFWFAEGELEFISPDSQCLSGLCGSGIEFRLLSFDRPFSFWVGGISGLSGEVGENRFLTGFLLTGWWLSDGCTDCDDMSLSLLGQMHRTLLHSGQRNLSSWKQYKTHAN